MGCPGLLFLLDSDREESPIKISLPASLLLCEGLLNLSWRDGRLLGRRHLGGSRDGGTRGQLGLLKFLTQLEGRAHKVLA